MSSTYDQPDWLKEGSGTTATPTAQEGAAAASNTFTSSLELDDGAAPPPTSPAASAANSSSISSSPNPCWRKTVRYLNWGVSLGLLAVFVASAVLQKNDANSSWNWVLFYAFHAATVALFFFFRACASVECIDKPLLVLGGGMLVWSVVMVAISGKQLSDAKSSDAGGDSDRLNDRQEKQLEVAGASLGLISAVYHVAIWKFCCQSAKRDG